MTRKPAQPQIKAARRDYANVLDGFLLRGQRPEGEGNRWTNKAFADRLSEILARRDDPAAEATIRTWRDTDNPSIHDLATLDAICEALFGKPSRQPAHEEKLRSAWNRAAGRTAMTRSDDESVTTSSDWDNRSEAAYIPGVAMHLNRPKTTNEPGQLRIEADLFIEPETLEHGGAEYRLGVKEPFLAIESRQYAVLQSTMLGHRQHDNFKPAAGGARITDPADGLFRIDGDPIGDTYVAVVEPKQQQDEEHIALLLMASRRCFVVTRAGNDRREVLHPNKDILLNALINDMLPKHPGSDRVILARADMLKKPRPSC